MIKNKYAETLFYLNDFIVTCTGLFNQVITELKNSPSEYFIQQKSNATKNLLLHMINLFSIFLTEKSQWEMLVNDGKYLEMLTDLLEYSVWDKHFHLLWEWCWFSVHEVCTSFPNIEIEQFGGVLSCIAEDISIPSDKNLHSFRVLLSIIKINNSADPKVHVKRINYITSRINILYETLVDAVTNENEKDENKLIYLHIMNKILNSETIDKFL